MNFKLGIIKSQSKSLKSYRVKRIINKLSTKLNYSIYKFNKGEKLYFKIKAKYEPRGSN